MVVAGLAAVVQREAVAVFIAHPRADGVHGIMVALDFGIDLGDVGHCLVVFRLAIGSPFRGFVFVHQVLQQGGSLVALGAQGLNVLRHYISFSKK